MGQWKPVALEMGSAAHTREVRWFALVQTAGLHSDFSHLTACSRAGKFNP